MSCKLVVAACLAIGAAACGPKNYVYSPVTTTRAEIVGYPAAELPFPPDSPHGNVRLATLGFAPPTAESPRSIHLRMVAMNRSGEAWTIDKREQQLAAALGNGKRTTILRPSPEPRE